MKVIRPADFVPACLLGHSEVFPFLISYVVELYRLLALSA